MKNRWILKLCVSAFAVMLAVTGVSAENVFAEIGDSAQSIQTSDQVEGTEIKQTEAEKTLKASEANPEKQSLSGKQSGASEVNPEGQSLSGKQSEASEVNPEEQSLSGKQSEASEANPEKQSLSEKQSEPENQVGSETQEIEEKSIVSELNGTVPSGEEETETAEEITEIEEVSSIKGASINDIEKNGTELVFGETVTDQLASGRSENWYKFTSSDNGYFQVKFAANEAADANKIGYGWNIYIYDDSDLTNCIKVYEGVTGSQLSAQLPMGNRRCYIKVCAKYNYSYSDAFAPIDCPYDLTVSFTSSDVWETEYNDTNANANLITVNKDYYGTLYQAKDVDWYKVQVTEQGYFQIKFTVDESTDRNAVYDGWAVTVYDSEFNEIRSYNGIKTSETEQILPYEKGTYYIKVCAYDRYKEPIDCLYRLQVVQTADKLWESERNDTQDTADVISVNKTYKGLLTSYKDIDWYRFNVKKSGTVKIKFVADGSVNIDRVRRGWDVYVYDKSSRLVEKMQGIKNNSSVQLDVGKGIYYIKICPNYVLFDYYAPTECIYNLSVNYSKAPSKVSIKSVKAGNKQATVTWKKASGATGYYVYRSTSQKGTYKKIATVKKASAVSYRDKSVKHKKTYYYMVVAYHTEKGIKAEAAPSAVKAVKIK